MDNGPLIALQTPHRIALLLISLFVLAIVLEIVRRGLLKERYALLWLAAAGLGLVFGVFPRLIVLLSHVLHVQYLTLLFALSFAFLLGLVLSFSAVISRQTERTRELTQEVALLAHQVKELEKRGGK